MCAACLRKSLTSWVRKRKISFREKQGSRIPFECLVCLRECSNIHYSSSNIDDIIKKFFFHSNRYDKPPSTNKRPLPNPRHLHNEPRMSIPLSPKPKLREDIDFVSSTSSSQPRSETKKKDIYEDIGSSGRELST